MAKWLVWIRRRISQLSNREQMVRTLPSGKSSGKFENCRPLVMWSTQNKTQWENSDGNGISVKKNPLFYRRYDDDTLTFVPNIANVSNFLHMLNKAYFSVNSTMETECNGTLPFLSIQLLSRAPQIKTKVYVKPTNSNLLLHHQRHVGNRYQKGLLRTMLARAHRLSSSWSHFLTNVTDWRPYSHAGSTSST